MNYKKRIDQKRLEALDELAAQAQELNKPTSHGHIRWHKLWPSNHCSSLRC